MTFSLRILFLAAIILGVFWCAYALVNGFQAADGDPTYFIPQAGRFLFWGVSGWAVFGSLGKIMERLERLERLEGARTTPSGD